MTGDLNVAHEEIDLKNPKTNKKNAGFTQEERDKFTELLGAGFVDSFRYLNPELAGAYTWWSYRFKAREKDAGWRIDYFVVSERWKEKIEWVTPKEEPTTDLYLFGYGHRYRGSGLAPLNSPRKDARPVSYYAL